MALFHYSVKQAWRSLQTGKGNWLGSYLSNGLTSSVTFRLQVVLATGMFLLPSMVKILLIGNLDDIPYGAAKIKVASIPGRVLL